MENCKSFFWGVGLGMAVGAMLVAKNKRLCARIRQFIFDANEKLEDAKEMVEDKIEEMSESASQKENKKSKKQ